MRTIDINVLDQSSIQDAVNLIERYEKELPKKAESFISSLAYEASVIAQNNFNTALYAGTNDVLVEFERLSGSEYRVEASGEATLFIEYGTGVSYPENAAEIAETIGHIYSHGEYGFGFGKQASWTYRGEPGNIGESLGNGRVKTAGNPANSSLYNAKKDVARKAKLIAEEVFND